MSAHPGKRFGLRPSPLAAGFQGVASVPPLALAPSGNVVLRCRSMPAIAASDIIRRLVRLVPRESLGELVLEMVEGALAAPPAAPPSAHVPNPGRANGNGSKRPNVPVPAPAGRRVARGKGRSA